MANKTVDGILHTALATYELEGRGSGDEIIAEASRQQPKPLEEK